MAGPPSRSSFPSAPGEPRTRRLGVGSTSGGDRPLRAQIVVAFVIVLVLIAVPLYLVRRPSGKSSTPAPSGSGSASAAPALADPPKGGPEKDAGKVEERLKFGPVQRIKCGSSPANAPNQGNLCDGLPFFEDALKKSIADTLECAPKAKESGSINYVLTVDFTGKKLHVYPGASGSWHGKQARRAANCVKRSLSAPEWATISHQYRFYSIALLANYEPPTPAAAPGSPATPKAPPGTPTFE